MIADTTPIPTPSGWTTMGGLALGDLVFDEAGRPCRVTAKFAPKVDEQYRVTFSDGSTIDACADHQWVTWTHAERKAFSRSPYEDASRFPLNWPRWRLKRKLGGTDLSREIVERAILFARSGMSARKIEAEVGCCRISIAPHLRAGIWIERQPVIHDDAPGPRIRTTRQIAETLLYGKRGDLNHCVPCCGALDLSDSDLPIPPYTLGVWLGDGSRKDATITSHESDMPFTRAAIEAEGFATKARKHPQNFSVSGLYTLLRATGVLGDKHVPALYMRASAAQRLALLRGLMDTDGNIEHGNFVSFVNTNKRLIDAFQELAHSLGMKTGISSGIGRCNGKAGKRFWRVQFAATINPFALPRKAAKIRIGGSQSLRSHHRMIAAVDRIDPVPMSCITVDSPNSMYLAGKAMIPTHNTRSGSEWVRDSMCGSTPLSAGKYQHMALVAETAADARDVMVGDGKMTGSGILAVHPPDFRPTYEPSKRRLTWPNGSIATIYNATEPDQLRGPEHSAAWCDELAKWDYAQDTWDMLQFGLRLGSHPRVVITTTPRPIPLLKTILKDQGTVTTRYSTLDNAANLPESFIESIKEKYAGTRLGRQEINAEILDDVPGALWTRAMIDAARKPIVPMPDMQRIVVAIDPSGVGGEDDAGDEIGIVIAGKGSDGRCYILGDRSCRLSPQGWGKRAVDAYHEYKADRIIAERNYGGAMVEHVIRTLDASVSYEEVVASRGKVVRAEPVSALYEQKRCSHAGKPDELTRLEDQMCNMTRDGYAGEGSPDRVDAAVWAVSYLMLKDAPALVITDDFLARLKSYRRR